LPSSVTSTVRTLLTDFDKDPHAISHDAQFCLTRFLKSRSFQAPYFHAISLFKPERLQPEDELFTPRDFIESFSGPEHALFTSLIFLHRQARRLSDEGLFDNATSWLQRSVNLGWMIGKSMKSVGPASALLVASYKWLGVLPFVRHDPEGFKLYARHLRTKDFTSTDIDFEHDRWECTSSQIGIMLLQRMGFGTARLVPLMRATTTISPLPPSDPLERAYRAAEVWMRYLLERRSVPSIPLPPSFYLSPQELDAITTRLNSQIPGRVRSWLNCSKHDISPDTTPQLFAFKGSSSAIGADDVILPGQDLMDELPSPAVLAEFGDAEEVDALLEQPTNPGEPAAPVDNCLDNP
jgi:hypothetical protein